MIAIPQARSQRTRTRTVPVPIPIGGDDSVSPGRQIPPARSIYSYNLIGAEYGLRSRLGWREWCTGLGGEQVRSLLPFNGSTSAANRLFACTQSGIWDVSSSSATPTRVVTFGTQNADSGWGQACAFVNSAGAHFLVYCDEANGYHSYAETGAVWTVGGISGTPISGADPAKLVGVLPWKNRLWFVERDSTRGWYLDLNAVSGAATSFTFGARFQRGGEIRGLWSWTGEAGTSIDDRLVAVSGSGDIVIYEGTDPSSADTFGIKGVWFAGAVPSGRRLCTDSGGDLLVMTSTGILPISRLTAGGAEYSSQYQTQQIANLWNQIHVATANLRGWGMRLHPQDSALMVLYPTSTGQPTQQLVMSLATKGWHRYRDMPIGVCAEPWNGTLYFGTEDGRVCVNDGYLDGVTLADPNSYAPIDWSLVTAYSQLGTAQRKRLHQIRVTLMSQGGAVPVNAQARYNFDISEAAAPSAAATSTAAGVWDTSLWDQAQWAGAYQVQTQTFGAAGSGFDAALAIRGSATSRITLVGLDVAWELGGWR